jgi:hypothetical protein
MAEGITVYGDYTMLGSDFVPNSNVLTIGGEYSSDVFFIGASYDTALSFDPAPPPGINASQTILGVYGGYNLLRGETFKMAVMGGYYNYNFHTDDGLDYFDDTITSIMVGVKGTANLDPIQLSLVYLFGVSNTWTEDVDGSVGTWNPDASLLEFKGVYQIGETFGVYAVYRSFSASVLGVTLSVAGFGAGVQATF